MVRLGSVRTGIEQLEEQKRRMREIEDFQKIKQAYNIRCEKCGRNKDISATPFEIYDIVNNKRMIVAEISLYSKDKREFDHVDVSYKC